MVFAAFDIERGLRRDYRIRSRAACVDAARLFVADRFARIIRNNCRFDPVLRRPDPDLQPLCHGDPWRNALYDLFGCDTRRGFVRGCSLCQPEMGRSRTRLSRGSVPLERDLQPRPAVRYLCCDECTIRCRQYGRGNRASGDSLGLYLVRDLTVPDLDRVADLCRQQREALGGGIGVRRLGEPIITINAPTEPSMRWRNV